ncbi:cytochrome C peroxidase [Dyadobacter sp. LJ53]|uniref:cytochrome-c peroxidase n=1 Tax=Dyadobacter chenwenxiniae TaxID=2906456 RepID=UPI001F42F20F|nr:cytochrome c peroxidase [Dyadobacter chenwenxiniae]MCF0050216.1 cytochrome C peroxidase [Dyadobacter chenwenxiniae]
MKNIVFAIFAGIVIFVLHSCAPQRQPHELVNEKFVADLDSLILMNDGFLKTVRSKPGTEALQKEFLKLRLQYKKVEAFAEYFFPTTVRMINGAPLDEIEDEENAVFEPGGLQVVEELIYTEDPVDQEELVRHARKMQVNVKRIKMLWADIRITDSHVMDALRLEMFRLISLGISGFDTPASGNALAESEVVLKSFQHYTQLYKSKLRAYSALDSITNGAIAFLKQNIDFNAFDRAAFISDHINPLCRSLYKNQELAAIPFMNSHKLLKGNVATIFDKNAFDPEALLSDSKFGATADRIALGKSLFYDNRISGDGKTNCGSCHQPEKAYADGLKTSKGFDNKFVSRNAPSIMYASLQQALFYDLRAPSLEDQAADVIHNKLEMHGSMDNVAKLVATDEHYKRDFKKAYPELDSIRPVYIQNAMATFVRSLNPFNSPFDKYMRGDKKALTDNQVKGFNVFMGKAKCGTCHFVPLFNGTVPPDYQRTESEVLGVTINANWKNPLLDKDPGRGVHDQFPQWKNAFKTSSVRNIAKTAPYMHNGAFATLQEVMEFYNEGGGAGLGLKVPNQTLAADKLNLTQDEIADVISFMDALTDAPE